MSGGEFGTGIPFAVGSVRGFRGWKVTTDGWLEPLSQSGRWFADGNEAICHGSPSQDQLPYPKEEDRDWTRYYAQRDAWRARHDMTECPHGFYAYTTAEEQYRTSVPAILGVIEGFGEVTIGTKGFRAMKARILALCVEPHQAMWRLEPFFVDLLKAHYPGVAFFDSLVAMRAEFPAELSVGTSS